MKFEIELKKGNFVISECKNCNKIVWPSSEICNQCLGKTIWKNANLEGKIIEFSKRDESYFCLAEFEENVRLMGKITEGTPIVGTTVTISKCGIRENTHFFEMSLVK